MPDVSVGFRPPCCHTDGHQHGVSIQISINLGKKFLCISRIRKIAVTRILARAFAYYLLSFPRFWTLSIDRFWFLFWSILNCMTLKTSNCRNCAYFLILLGTSKLLTYSTQPSCVLPPWSYKSAAADSHPGHNSSW